ncbi:MAG: hypothetical protein N2690_05335, partial [Rhodocyclaceae bacterium]|nr:hypothetical protein [Rhodocyclaceae bacterium]
MIRLTVTAHAQGLRTLPTTLRASVAKALTHVAFEARDEVRRSLPQRFTLRRPWVSQGILAQGATARELKAAVGSRDAFMVGQETGGTRPGPNAIPLGPLAKQARTRVIPESQWPRQLLRGKGVFVRRGIVLNSICSTSCAASAASISWPRCGRPSGCNRYSAACARG